MAVAALFDLDRTLLAGASGPVFSRALRRVGLLGDKPFPGEDLVFGMFNLVGETRGAMWLTRNAVRATKGWSLADAQRAAVEAADELADLVQPYARVLIDEHHREGRLVAIATTTPAHLVAPLAERLGVDGVIATRYGSSQGKLDGTIVGPFVWGKGKLEAARAWCADHDVDLAQSWAYSDSWFDVPLLSSVAHPVAVNPDPRLRVYATARRWPVQHLDVPPRVPKLGPVEPQTALLPLLRPELVAFARIHVEGAEHLPSTGAAILAANHRSYFDPVAMGFAAARVGRPLRFLGKKEVFDAPMVGDLARAMGGIRVERGSGSDAPLREAADALAAGELVAIMPQGTIPRGEEFFEPVLKGRPGTARLAAMSGAPVVPVAVWGTEAVWPRNARVPNVWNVLDPPDVTIRVGQPVELGLDDPTADTEAIMAAIVDLLPAEAREVRAPTTEQIERSRPPS
jgi:putative phosphoserine phosphatase/1-acylglycerol-3-phosphate O-acyltransferase